MSNRFRNKQKPSLEPRLVKKSKLLNLSGFQIPASRLLALAVYLGFWATVYIANHHYGERTVRRIDTLRGEIENLKADYHTINAQLSNRSMQSRVAAAVAPHGLKQLTEPPKRLKVHEQGK